MRVLTLDPELRLRDEYPEPRPRVGESVVKVRLAGICGTDLELACGYMAYRGVLGHEFVGEVVESADAGCAAAAWSARSTPRAAAAIAASPRWAAIAPIARCWEFSAATDASPIT